MKNLILMFFIIVTVMVFFGCQEDNALAPLSSQSDQDENALSKPTPNTIGEVYTDFTFTPPTFWNGTIDFGGGKIYGLTFISHGPPRDYSQASPFEENFVIYKLGSNWQIQENVYLYGWNAGVSSHANRAPDPMKFRANGKITDAYGDFAEWQGRSVHIRGTCENWVWSEVPVPGWLPDYAEATFRIN